MPPILFIIFNRPDTTEKVFAQIREARPERLFVAADGPRSGNAADRENCAAARGIIDKVDWPCEVVKRYQEENLGCKAAVSSAISWFFEHEEMGIILEDDCLPDMSFFKFCEEGLERYKDDARVFHINGSNYQNGWVHDREYSYYFSRLNSIWGWASWRRAWKFYDVGMKSWPEIKHKSYYLDMGINRMDAVNRAENFDRAYSGKVDTWDYQWTFAIMANSGVCITPNVNLVSNIGFGSGATHTQQQVKRASLPVKPMNFPLKHPPFMIADSVSDRRLFLRHGRRGVVWTLKNVGKLLLGH